MEAKGRMVPYMTTLTLTLRPFTKNDWLGMAGAVPFEDGSEPLIGSLMVDGLEAVVVIDREGLGITVDDEEGDSLAEFYWHGQYAARAVALLRPEMTSEALENIPGVESVGSSNLV